MATFGRVFTKILQSPVKFTCTRRSFVTFKHPKSFRIISATCLCIASGGLVFYVKNKFGNVNTVHAFKARKLDDELVRAVKLTSRERRFIKFASVEYDGQLYMTPQDFLESVVEQEPRPRLKRRVLTSKELEMIRDQTPPLSQSSPQMFRTLRDKGIISYTEYLFLLSILTKPRTGFEIAFNMFDTDGNQRVDKNEFLVIRQLLGGNLLQDREIDEKTQIALMKLVSKSFIVPASPKKQKEEEKTTPPSFKYLQSVMLLSFDKVVCSTTNAWTFSTS